MAAAGLAYVGWHPVTATASGRTHPVLRAGPLELDLAAYTATLDGNPITLTTGEVNMLAALVSAHPATLGRRELHRAMWSGRWRARLDTVDLRTVTVGIARIRRVLGEHATMVETVRYLGYRWAEQPERLLSPAEPAPGHLVGTGELAQVIIAAAVALRARPVRTLADRRVLERLAAHGDVRWLARGGVSR